VVGASASGVQIADELSRAGRQVVLAVGRHTRIPRRYRGMDIFWWLERTGRLARTIDDVRDPVEARREPSMQLVGRRGPDGCGDDIDLRSLQTQGVRLTGRMSSLNGGTAYFRDDLAGNVTTAQTRLTRLLASIDRHIDDAGLSREVLSPHRPEPVPVPPSVPAIDLAAEGIGSVVLATGFRPDYSWVHLPAHGADRSLSQRRGVTPVPGLYVVGQRFQHRRDSAFIDGARHDAGFVVRHLLGRVHPVEHVEQGAS
jgi:putative flavoprotein involved in K+ transport